MESRAPSYTTNETRFASIEFPGPVKSIPRALRALGGLSHISTVLSSPDALDKPELELNLSTGNPFFHPVQAAIRDTGNVVMKVVKRRRKVPRVGEDGKEELGLFSMEVVGTADRTVRFRGYADFQHPTKLDDPIVDISQAMREMDVEAILAFRFPEMSEDCPIDEYITPPQFTGVKLAIPYNFQGSGYTAVVTATPTSVRGDDFQRLTSSNRATMRLTTSISFADADVPTKQHQEGKGKEGAGASDVNETVKKRLLELLEERPVWTRASITNQLTPEHARIVVNQKQTLQAVSYTFSDGPFRDLVIRFGFDPRLDRESRFYQHVVLRNVANVRVKHSVAVAMKGKTNKEATSNLSHIFDGISLHSKIGNFQLIDITDPLVRRLIDSEAGVLDTCSSDVEGWFKPEYFEQIRQVVRRKFMGILSNLPVSDGDCADLMEDPGKVKELEKGEKGRKKKGGEGSGSGTEASESGASGAEGGKKVKPAWEKRKKKTVGAKKSKGVENIEEMAQRVRGNIAKGSGASGSK